MNCMGEKASNDLSASSFSMYTKITKSEIELP